MATQFPKTTSELDEYVDDRVKQVLQAEGADMENEEEVPTISDDELQADNLLLPLILTNEQSQPQKYVKARVGDIANIIGTSQISESRIAWIDEQMEAADKEEAQKKFAVTTTPDGNSSYYADEVSSKQMTVKVYTTFGGDPVDCGAVAGWQHTAGTNEYTKVITASNGSGATCAAQTFSYTVPSGGYAGITVTGESEKRSISAVKPFYYGWADTNNTNNIQAVMNAKTLTRVTSNTGSGKFTQQPGDMSWFWIVVPEGRTASVTQAGGTNIMKSAATATPESPYGQGIYLPCKVYVSEQYFERGKEIDIDWKVS